MEKMLIKDEIREIYRCITARDEINERIKGLQRERDEYVTRFNGILDTDESLRKFISEKLCEKMGLATDDESINEFKMLHPQKYSTSYSSSISSGDEKCVYTETKIPEEDTSYFHPMLDKWEISSVDCSTTAEGGFKYKFTVECVKQRSHIGYGCWIPKLYSTEWFIL